MYGRKAHLSIELDTHLMELFAVDDNTFSNVQKMIFWRQKGHSRKCYKQYVQSSKQTETEQRPKTQDQKRELRYRHKGPTEEQQKQS